VRSIRDVFGLIIAECHIFPTAWGHESPAGAESGFGGEIRRARRAATGRGDQWAELSFWSLDRCRAWDGRFRTHGRIKL